MTAGSNLFKAYIDGTIIGSASGQINIFNASSKEFILFFTSALFIDPEELELAFSSDAVEIA
jgi:hypothetical protein